MQIFLVTLMFATQACTSCYPASLPSAGNDDGEDPDNQPIDTATEEEETGDLPTPPLCEFPEVEPNNNIAEPTPIQAEAWACGELMPDDADTIGIDFVSFDSPGQGWISLWARGESIGSAADIDMNVTIESAEGSALVVFERSPGTHEPLGLIPVNAEDEFVVGFVDAFRGMGEGYVWEFLPSLEKGPPLDWNLHESESRGSSRINDRFADATTVLSDGDRIFGAMGNADRDNADVFRIAVPAGRHLIQLSLLAWEYGSPLNGQIKLYTPDVVDYEAAFEADPSGDVTIADARVASNRYRHSDTWDPYVDYIVSADEPTELYVSVTKANDYFGPYHWYVLDVSITAEEIDDTATP